MIDLSNIKNYYLAVGYTDLRRGIDGLAEIITLQFGYEINEDSLFLFCGRKTDRIKALWFSGDGYVLLYKRLNNGRFQWPCKCNWIASASGFRIFERYNSGENKKWQIFRNGEIKKES